MWVAPEYRGRGVGKGLVDAVRKWAEAQGVGVLKAWVSESNEGAEEFYERLGFKATGIQQALPSNSEVQETLLILECV